MILTTGQPYWLTLQGLVRYPVLEADLHCDVAIVGGGITGALVGYYLAQAGLAAAVFDAAYVGAGSTSASTAMCQYELDVDLHQLREQIGIGRANDAYLANRYAVHELGRLCGQLSDDCGYQPCHSLYLASSRRQVADLELEGDARRGLGIAAEFVPEADLRRRWQLKASAALLSGDTAQVNSYQLTHTLLREAAARGLRVFERTPVTGYQLAPDGQSITVQAGGHRVRARYVVMCTGYYAEELVPQDLVSLHSTYVVISRPGMVEAGQLDNMQIWETARPYLYTRTTPDGRIMVGGADDPVSGPSIRNALLESKVDTLEKKFRSLFDHPVPFTRDFVWGGIYGKTRDGLPFIGQHRDFPRTWFALGYGGNGTTYSLLAAEIIRDALTGQAHPYADTFGFDRVGAAAS